MLIAATAAILIFFGGSSSGFFGGLTMNFIEDPIENTITDEARRKDALEGLSLLKEDIENFNKLVSEDIEKFSELVKNYNSTPEEFDITFSSGVANRQEILNKVWEDRSKMLSNISPDEWQTIVTSAKLKAAEE